MAETREVVNLIIKATDQASQEFDAASQRLEKIGVSATLAQTKLAALATTILTLGGTAISTLGELGSIIALVQSTLDTEVGQTFLTTLNTAIEETLSEGRQLTQVLSSITSVAAPVLQGVFSQAEFAEAGAAALGPVGTQLGTTLGNNLLRGIETALNSGFGRVANQVDRLLTSSFKNIQDIPNILQGPLEGFSNAFISVSGAIEPVELFQNIRGAVAEATRGIGQLSEQIFFFTSAFNILQQFVANGPFKLLIGQNVELREQLLATQATLVSTQKVIQGGFQLEDPTQAIQALQQPIEQAIKDLREGSLELVGVTSSQLVPIFQQVAQQASLIGASLDDVTDLTLKFSAALGTLGVPLFQSRQEIQSIVTATIDQNSILAKSLGITNEQVRTWIAQGRVIEELNRRLEGFAAGNALAARTINGIGSNIQEIFEEITRVAGEPLIEPIVVVLERLFNFLNQNRDNLSQQLGGIVEQIGRTFNALVDSAETLLGALSGFGSELPRIIFTALANAAEALAVALENVVVILGPAIQFVQRLAEIVSGNLNFLFTLVVQFKLLQVGISSITSGLGTLLNAIPGVGEAIFLLNQRIRGSVAIFTNLSQLIGNGGAAFLVLGQNLNLIPGAAKRVTDALGPIGKVVSGLIPQFASFGVSAVGLFKLLPQSIQADLLPAINTFVQRIPDLLKGLSVTAASSERLGVVAPAVAKGLSSLSEATAGYVEQLTDADKINRLFARSALGIGNAIRAQIIQFGAVAVAVVATFAALNTFIDLFKNLADALEPVLVIFRAIGTFLVETFTNPIIQSIVAVTALTVAIQAGLIPTLIGLINNFRGFIQVQILKRIGDINSLIIALIKNFVAAAQGSQSFNEAFRKLGQTLAGFVQGEDIKDLLTGILPEEREVNRRVGVVNRSFAALGTAARRGFRGAGQSLGTFLSFLNNTNVSFAGFANGARVAGTAAIGLGRAIGGVAAGITAALGPLILATGAAIAFAAALNAVIKVNQLSTESYKKFADAVEDSNEKLREAQALQENRGGINPQELDKDLSLAETRQQVATKRFNDRVRELQNGSNVIARIFAANIASSEQQNFGLILDDARNSITSFNNALEKQGELEKERIALVAARARAEARGSTVQAENLGKQIEGIEEEINLRQEAVNTVTDQFRRQLPTTAEGIRQQAVVLQQLEEVNDKYNDLRNTEIAAADLPTLGLAFEQLARQADAAEQAIARGTGQTAQITQKSQELLKVTQQQLQTGQISAQEAVRRFRLLTNNANIEAETAENAQKAITAAIQTENQRREEDQKAAIARIQLLAEEGFAREIDVARRTTEFRRNELDKQIEDARRGRSDALADFDAGLNERLQGLRQEQLDLNEAANNALASGDTKLAESRLKEATEVQVKILQVEADSYVAREAIQRDFNNLQAQLEQQRAQIIEEQRKREIDQIFKDAETRARRLASINSNALQLLANQGLVNEERAALSRTQVQERSARERLEIARNTLQEIQRTRPQDEDSINEATQRLLDAGGEVLKLQEQLIEAQVNLVRKAYTDSARDIQNALDAQNESLKEQRAFIDVQSESLGLQVDLLRSRKDLANVSFGSLTDRLEIVKETQQSEFEQQELAQVTAAIKIRALEVEQRLALQTLQIEEERNRLALEREDIENRLAQAALEVEIAEGQGDIAAAEQDPRVSQRERTALQNAQQERLRQRELLAERALIIGRERAQSEETFRNQRRILQLQQEDQRFRARFDLTQQLPAGERERAQQALQQQIAESLGAANIDQVISDGLTEVDRVLRQEGLGGRRGGNRSGDFLSARDPNLARARSNAGADSAALAGLEAQARRDFQRQFGNPSDFLGAANDIRESRRRGGSGRGLDISGQDRAIVNGDFTPFAAQGLAGLLGAAGQNALVQQTVAANQPGQNVTVQLPEGAVQISSTSSPEEVQQVLNDSLNRVFIDAGNRLQQLSNSEPQPAAGRE